MRLGLFCTYENPQNDYPSAYAEQTELVLLAEELGFDEAWIAEHHFNPSAASPSPLLIIAHLAGLTSRIRLGSAAVLLPFCDPIHVAEQAATVDILSRGRFDLGVAKGGPFARQFKHFHLDAGDARAKMDEALVLVDRLLHEESVTFEGRFFRVEGVELTPKPVQRRCPIYVATSTADTVRRAATAGLGVMAAPVFPLARVEENLRWHGEAAPGVDPRLVLIRFVHVAATRANAIAEAEALLTPFVERMRAATAALQPDWTPWIELRRLIADSIVGSPSEIRAKTEELQATLAPRSLVLKPLSPDLDRRKACLRLFAEQLVRTHA
ncbi:MAG TPA: LLM class flavin-dependent oxidoreductase [Methylocystis sp.]|nr:LLM class flavin-dependent oxidoreductase [Methylocystis sp.]